MGEQTKKTNLLKWLAGAAGVMALGAAVAFGVLTSRSGETEEQPVGVSVTPTMTVAEVTPEPERTVTVAQELTPTEEVAYVATGTVTPIPELSPTWIPTATPSPTVSPTVTLSPTVTPSAFPTEEVVMSTNTVTPTPIPTNTPTVKPMPSPTAVPTPDPKDTITPTPTETPTMTPKPTVTLTVMPTATPKPTNTPAPTNTPRPTQTPTPTPTNTPTPTSAPAAWTEPKERKDLAELLMAKVQAYRENNGIRRLENPYEYYDVNDPDLGEWLMAKGLRVAKKCCLEHSANHEGYQIATGIYGYPWRVKEGSEAEDIAQRLFEAWYNSSAHNKNMLNDHTKTTQEVDVGVMHVVEYFDGEDWHYCAVMSVSCVFFGNLPEGLE